MELSESGKVKKRYIRGNDLILSDKGTENAPGEVSGKQYYVTDPHGNVVQLTDESGRVTKTYEYDSFGNEVKPDSKDDNSFRYCGEYYDKETEEIYLRARYYQPKVGRFLTRDTYTGEEDEPESLHLYAYCEHDGVNAWDPSGHDAVWLQYAYGAGHMGHTGLALQDINRQWYYFFWGSTNSSVIYNFFFKPYAKRYLEPIDSITKFRKKPKKLKKVVYNQTKKYYEQKLTGSIYFQGDFSESYNYLKDYRGRYNTNSNNCLQVCLRALDYGKFKNNVRNLKGYAVRRIIKEKYVIPNNAFSRLKKLLGK